MVLLAIACFAAAVVLAVLAFKPRKTWWVTTAWAYRRPEAAEPPDARYALAALGYGLSALVLAGMGVYVFVEARSWERAEERRDECEEILDEIADVFTDVDHLEPVRARADELGVRIEVEPMWEGAPSSMDRVNVMQGDD